MKKATFAGYSDHLVHAFVNGKGDEFNVIGGEKKFGLVSKEGFLAVIVRYEFNACWSVTPLMWDEDTELPEWPIYFEKGDAEYSMLMTVDVPDDTKLLSSL